MTDYLHKARIDVVAKVLDHWIGDSPTEQHHMLDSYSKRLDIAEAIVRELRAMDEVLARPVDGLHIELRDSDGFWLVMLDPERMYASQSRFLEAFKFFEEIQGWPEEVRPKV